jgi:hypothetical protein
MYSILHITDLHRAKTDPISNSELISALVSDCEDYGRETPAIKPPDAIVISGDVIQGVTLSHPEFEHELAAQYDVAHDFLASLADRFLDGDRTKVIIVPGNHDIDWNVAFSSMELVGEDAMPSNLPVALFERDSPYRWDWKSRRLYRIKDEYQYSRRLAAFWTFFERFYGGYEGMLRVASWSNANLYSLDNGRIGVAAFNSCAGNDCFAFHGEIPRDAVAQAHLDLKDLGPWRLRVAVWHHDIDGPPQRADYMDLEIVRGMIGRGFRLGLYGHQHRVQITPQHAHLLNQETMVVASAGSLCAGRRELPMGALRGYSIIEIRDDYSGARVHVREMRVANLFSRAVLRDFEGRSYVDLEWTTPLDSAGRLENPTGEERIATLGKAEDALRGRNDPAEALRLLSTIDIAVDAFGRRLALEAAVTQGDPLKLIEIIREPQTIEELVQLVDAQIAVGNDERAESVIAEHAMQLSLPEVIKTELQTKINLKKWIKS